MAGRVERTERMPFDGEATLFLRSAQHRVTVQNLSSSGMLLELPAGVVPAHFMRLQFQLGPEGRWMQLDALFAREDYEAGRQRWGVRFLEPPAAFAEALQHHAETVARAPHLKADSGVGPPNPHDAEDPPPGGAPAEHDGGGGEAPTPGSSRSRIWG